MLKPSFALVATLVTAQAFAGGYGLKPGLWESKVLKTVVDGADKTADLSGLNSKMADMMAKMPPEQRARMEAMMKQRGVGIGADGGAKLCITPEMANKDRPTTEHEGRCGQAQVSHIGNKTTFAFECANADGSTSNIKGEATALGDLITTAFDMTRKTSAGDNHTTHMETEMRFLNADCGDIKPIATPKQ